MKDSLKRKGSKDQPKTEGGENMSVKRGAGDEGKKLTKM
jgi:hypothetical protein